MKKNRKVQMIPFGKIFCLLQGTRADDLHKPNWIEFPDFVTMV